MSSDYNDKSQDWESGLKLTTITRVVLVCGIIFVLGATAYTVTRPEESDILFFVLNEDQVMKDFPTNTTVGGSVSFHAFIENHLLHPATFAVRIYRCEANILRNITAGVADDPLATYLENQTITLDDGEGWISNKISVTFPSAGSNQPIILELWINTTQGWQYIPDYMLFLQISVN
ncbi:MAG: DUF1616 domain-containing protein [Promethearchaeota archaeon]